MRVLMVLPTDGLGGAEGVLKTLATQICSSADHELHVVFLSKGNNGRWSDLTRATLHFYEAPRELLGAVPAAMLVARLSRRPFDFAIASHTHCSGFLAALRALGLLRVRTLVARESTLIGDRFTGAKRRVLQCIYRVLYPFIDAVVCQTQFMRSRLLAFVPALNPKRLVVIPNPIDVARAKLRATDLLAVKVPARYCVAMGRLVPVKRFDVLLRAFAKIASGAEGLDLVLLGDGPEHNTLVQLADELGVRDRVHFLGHQSNPFPVVTRARFGVLSSDIEGFPNVVLEMLALGLPVVSTRCTEYLDELPGVAVCPTGDPAALAEAMLRTSIDAGYPHEDVASALARRTPQRFFEQFTALRALSRSAECNRPLAASSSDHG